MVKEGAPNTKWLVGTELNLVNRLAEEVKHEGKVVQFLAPTVCMCSTMQRIDPQHLAWTLENLADGNVVTSILQSAVLEADAHAHDRAVMRECQGGVTTVDHLRGDFAKWYDSKGRFYTHLERDKHAAVLGVGTKGYPDFNIEVQPQEAALRRIGVLAERDEDIVRLGKSFNGKNYLAGWFNDAIARHLHAPDRVVRAFNAAAPRDGVIEAVMKKQIANKLTVPALARRLPG